MECAKDAVAGAFWRTKNANGKWVRAICVRGEVVPYIFLRLLIMSIDLLENMSEYHAAVRKKYFMLEIQALEKRNRFSSEI